MLVDEGRISPEEASSHPQRSLLTRALDGRDIDPEYSVRQVMPGDRYLICSDGLSGVVSGDTIWETLRQFVHPRECVERLVQLALRGGGPDNITVIVADATDADIVEEAPVVGGAAARDRGMATVADRSTPAARASALSAPRAASPEPNGGPNREEESDRGRRHPVRTTLLLLVLLGLLGGGLWYGWSVTQRQYYVGATEEGNLAVFRGVPGQIAGLDLSTVHKTSDTTLEELTSVAQERVKQGIQAKSEIDAERQLADLTNDDPSNPNLKPTCPPSPSPSASAAATNPPQTATPVATASATPSPTAGGVPPVTATPDAQPSESVPPVSDPAGCRPDN
jgi:protein phosphatase